MSPETVIDAIASLTPREAEVLELRRRGMGNQEIACALWVSIETVKTHLKRAREKGVTTMHRCPECGHEW